MNNYLKSALVIFLIFSFTEIHAQLSSDYIFGVNLSTMTLKINGVCYDPETPAGVHFGGFYELSLTRHFALQPSFLFSAKGADYKIDTSEVSIAPVYIEVPVNASYSFGSKGLKVSLFSGPYFACAIGGYKLEPASELKYLRYGSGEDRDLRRFDIGVNYGARVNIHGFRISVQYGTGLSNISPLRKSDSVIKNKVIGISISGRYRGSGTKTHR
jgi:hypothetical protein